tara:strand:- start:258 stop:473 length:216 start_codon:yes stop_codon:yes gene_type:complete
MVKTRTIEELRQTKDSVYSHPDTHKDFEFVTHRFTESKLIDYITECVEIVKMQVDEKDIKEIEDFVKTNKS